MTPEEFLEFLKRFVKEVNVANKYNDKKIILDKRYFDLASDGAYSANESVLDLFSNASFCIVGDNPGKRENENSEYFYFDGENIDKRTAGYKIKSLIDESNIKPETVLFFNKCLLSTSKTSQLNKTDIEKTEELVIDFISNLLSFNNQILFVFLGTSKKFEEFYKKLSKKFDLNKAAIYHHPCNIKDFNPYELEELLNRKDIDAVIRIDSKFDLFGNESASDDSEENGGKPNNKKGPDDGDGLCGSIVPS